MNGILVLNDAYGTVVWQTSTANMGVVGLTLLPNSNLVLHDENNKFIWESFDYPTDTLLLGQLLKLNFPRRVVSRVSDIDDSKGLYSFVLEQNYFSMYLTSQNSQKPLIYYKSDNLSPKNKLKK